MIRTPSRATDLARATDRDGPPPHRRPTTDPPPPAPHAPAAVLLRQGGVPMRRGADSAAAATRRRQRRNEWPSMWKLIHSPCFLCRVLYIFPSRCISMQRIGTPRDALGATIRGPAADRFRS